MKQNVLIIGAGKIGSIRASVIRKLSKSSKIFIFDKVQKNANTLSKKVSGEVCKSVDNGLKNSEVNIVIISVINKYSKALCIKALKAGKHVLLEKPMGMNYKEALEISKAAKKYKKIFKCGFNHRYHPGLKEAHKQCKNKKIGKLLFIRGAYGHGGRAGYDKEWRAKKSLCGGGELLDQGCHLIDLSHWFFGFESLKRQSSFNKTMFWNMEVDDNAFTTFETKSGKVAQLHASWTQWKNMFRFEIYGDKGSIEVNGLGKSYGTETVITQVRTKLGAAPKVTKKEFKGEDKSWELEWKDFTKSIKNKTKVMSNEVESLLVMKTISMLYNQ